MKKMLRKAMLMLPVILLMLPMLSFAKETKKPAMVQGFKVVSTTENSVKLSWKPVSKATSYKIYSDKSKKKLVHKGTDTTFTHKNLPSKKGHSYYIWSSNSAGDSIDYNYAWGETKKSTIQAVTRPTMVQNFKVTSVTENSVGLKWDAVKGATSYKIYLNNDKSKEVYNGSSTSFTHKNLQSGTDYEYYIYSHNSAGTSYDYNYAWAYTNEQEEPVTPPPVTEPETPVVPPASPLKERIANVVDYKYYLNDGSPEITQKMKTMDLVVVEPLGHTKESIKEVRDSGTIVFAYINSMEADKWNEELYSKFVESDFWHDSKGNRMYHSEWDSYELDMTSQHTQELLLEEIEKLVVNGGYDGVFLDTVGNIDSYHTGQDNINQQKAMKQFMQKIKERFNGLPIAQNWGFTTLEDYTAPYVDFIMWEGFNPSYINGNEWASEQIKMLQQKRSEYGVQTFTVSYEEKDKARALAESYGFKNLYNPAGSYYNTW
ncbi:endo alpha-1,4 polygalactosaminidase [Pseudobutyrivibrio sp.]